MRYWNSFLIPILTILVGIATFGLRAINLDRSYDIFTDEITYFRIALGVADNLHVKLYGETFYLHPPAFFYIEAAYIRLLGVSGSMIDQIYAVRYLNVGFASVSAMGLFLIGQRIAGGTAGFAAALFFALDSFIIKMNSFNLLDTSALFWIVAGYCMLLTGIDDDRTVQPEWHMIAAGTARRAAEWNYGDDALPLLDWIEQHGKLVFTFRGKGDSVLNLYQLSTDVRPAHPGQ